MRIAKIKYFWIFLTCVLFEGFVDGMIEIADEDKINKDNIELSMGILNEYGEILRKCEPIQAEWSKGASSSRLLTRIASVINDDDSEETKRFQHELDFEKRCVGYFDNKSAFHLLVTVIMKYWSLKYSGIFATIYYSYGQIRHGRRKTKQKPENSSQRLLEDKIMDASLKLTKYLAEFGLNQHFQVDYLFELFWGPVLPEETKYGNIKKINEEAFPELDNSIRKLVKLVKNFEKNQKLDTKSYEKVVERFAESVLTLDDFFARVIYSDKECGRYTLRLRTMNLTKNAYTIWDTEQSEHETKISQILRKLEEDCLRNLTTIDNIEYKNKVANRLDLTTVNRGAKFRMVEFARGEVKLTGFNFMPVAPKGND